MYGKSAGMCKTLKFMAGFYYLSRMLIEEKTLQHWMDNFYGYGSWEAKIWFVAFEESGGDLPEDVAERINYFQETHPEKQSALCDIRDLYQHVGARLEGPRAEKFATLFDHRFGTRAIIHGGWKNLIAFAHGYTGKDLPDLLAYQKKSFAHPSAKKEAFINLYPLPAPHNHAWYYSWLNLPAFKYFKSRTLYQETIYANRISTILKNISIYKPNVVLLYGMSNINLLKKSVQDFFPEAIFKTEKAVKLQLPNYHRADLKHTTLIITTQVPTLRHNRVETGFDWNAFGRMISR